MKKFMNLEGTNFDFSISYQMDNDSPPMPISSDWNLAFYIDLKRSVSDAMKYPLCVDKVEQIQLSCSPTGVWDLVCTTNTIIHGDTNSVSTLFSYIIIQPYCAIYFFQPSTLHEYLM